MDAYLASGDGDDDEGEAEPSPDLRMASEPSIQVDMEEMKPRTSAGSIETRSASHASDDQPAVTEGTVEVNFDDSFARRTRLQSEPGVPITFDDEEPVATPQAPPREAPRETIKAAPPPPDFDPLESPALKSRLQSQPILKFEREEVEAPPPPPRPPVVERPPPPPEFDPLESPALKSRLQSQPILKFEREEIVEEVDALEEDSQVGPATPSAPARPAPVVPPIGLRPPAIPPRPPAIPPRPPGIPTPPKLPAIKPPAIPPPRQTAPGVGLPVPTVPPLPPRPAPPLPPRAAKLPTGEHPTAPKTPTGEQPVVPRTATADRRPSTPVPADRDSQPKMSMEDVLAGAADITTMEGGVEVGTETPNVVIDQPLETHLESPTVVEKAISALGEAAGEARATALSEAIDARELGDPTAAAFLAYELGELAERRLADEARAVKAFGRALNLDPSLRPNLWAIRRVFYRRALWPNLQRLVDAEVEYARDDSERADLLLEKARVSNHRLNQPDDARAALDEAVTIAPTHQGALLELERVIARSGDVPALLDVWDRLAEAVEQPARKIAYLVELARTAAAGGNVARAQEALDKAAVHATASGSTSTAERVARERLRIAEENGGPADVESAIDALATVLLAAFGPAGPAAEAITPVAGERPPRSAALRLELVALRRRQAQLARRQRPERAWDHLQQALALSPGEPIVLADLTELAEELGRYEELAELVQNWQSVEGDPARAMTLSIRRADALLRGGHHDQARSLLASLESSAPGFIVLTSAAERDALATKDPAALAATYQSAAAAAMLGTWLGPGQPSRPDPKSAATLYVQAAELLAYEVATPAALDDARTALGKALEAVPDHPAALEALIELDDLTGRVTDALVRMRASAAAASSSDDKRAIIERAIRLARSHGELEATADLQRELISLVPSDIGARWRLEATLAQLGRDDARAELLASIAADETDAVGRGTALLAAARLRERAGGDGMEAATGLYRQVLALSPDDVFARESLLDLLRAQEKWDELVTERIAEARTLPDGGGARRALREAAWILEIRIGNAAKAAEVYADWLARMPDDRTALEGLARCRAATGDAAGEVAVRARIAETDRTLDSIWLHARALERAGQHDDAAEQYRALIGTEEASVAASTAALALGDLAVTRGDTIMRVEATAGLAGRTGDPRLAAALAEDSGWMYALVLEDHERAAQSFEAAIALDATRRGAHLGAALTAARRNDAAQAARAYEGLAASVEMPEAAAALLLRGAAVAAASGDLDVANQRVINAQTAAPDDTSALLVLAEMSAISRVDNLDASATGDALLTQAELLEMRSALADDASARASWELDRAEALELAGRLRAAGAVVSAVLKTRPDDLRALTMLRRLARRAGDFTSAATAAYTLARGVGDPAARLDLLREAAVVFDGRGLSQNTDYAIACYRRILAHEPGASEYERLVELLRERGDAHALIAALTDRITFFDGDGATGARAVPLLLERATVLHSLGDTEAAMADLDVLLERAPANVEALRFRADLAFNGGDVQTAVALWRRYIVAETRPSRRGEIELQLAQVLAENTNDIGGAIESLEHVVDANPEDAALRERLLGLCLRASDWERAVRELRSLARLRPTPQERAREELRLGLMLRDRLGDKANARLALDRARSLDPLNLDVVRELSDLLDPATRAQVLALTADNFRESIAAQPGRGVLYEKLAQVNAWQADVDARWVSLVAVELLATPSVDQRQVLAAGRSKLVAPTRVKLDDAARLALRGDLGGTLLEVWRVISTAVQTATGVEPSKLGFARGDRLALKKLGDRYEPLATALACFGIDDVDLYISANRAGFARALAGETPVLCLGADVAAASTPQHRFLLGRAVATLAEGVAGLADLREGELAWTIAAALQAVDLQAPSALAELIAGEEKGIAERSKLLKKEMSRKAKAALLPIVNGKGPELGAVDAFKRSAAGLGNRTGLLWASDLAVALAILDVGKGGRAIGDSPAALDLAAWSVSRAHLELREKLGIALKGAPR